MASVLMVAERANKLRIAVSAALLLSATGACSTSQTKEETYFHATELCQSFFMNEIEKTLQSTSGAVELPQFFREVNKNATGNFADLLRRSSAEFKLSLGADRAGSPLNRAHRILAYEAVSTNIKMISQCENLEVFVSTYLLSDQVRLALTKRNIPLSSSALDVDVENDVELAKALLAGLVSSDSERGP